MLASRSALPRSCSREGGSEVFKRLTAANRVFLVDQHAAAARADAGTYFSLFAADGVFIGTDATERWTVPEFKAYAKTAFDAGQGWTYVPQSRHITVETGEHPHVAWFDELLKSKEFSETRGTGVLMNQISDQIKATAQAGKQRP